MRASSDRDIIAELVPRGEGVYAFIMCFSMFSIRAFVVNYDNYWSTQHFHAISGFHA